MIGPALVVMVAAAGQYGGGYVSGHCAHLARGFCSACVYHNYNYQPAAFAADPTYYAGVVAAAIRKQAADEAAAKAARDNASKLDARLSRIEAAITARLAENSAPATAKFTPQPPPAAPQPATTLPGVLQQCDACHSAESKAGGLALFDADGAFKTPDLWTKVKIHERLKPDAPKRMPPPNAGPALAPAERAVVADSIRTDLDAIAKVIKE